MMNAKRGLGIVAAMIVAGTSLTVVAAQASAGPASPISRVPKIVARPASVRVNTRTELSGSGFRPHHKLTIWECSARGWVVPQQVCNHKNAVHVTTDGAGRFRTRITVLVCPARRRMMVAAGFSRTCYVGVPAVRGVDTETLVGAAKITVTGP
jgi:hypothetical protein